jgi:GNAT superfamily N-acetyltransferase
MHIASCATEVEFGVMVSPDYRNQGIANTLMDEAITWARNRHYKDLFMHCISWNRPTSAKKCNRKRAKRWWHKWTMI